MSEKLKPVDYSFTFKKDCAYKKKNLLKVSSSGKFSLLKECIDDINSIFTFRNLDYKRVGIKEPLLINPVKWHYNKELNIAEIKSKDKFKPIWNRYKDKYSNAGNQSLFLTLERFYFHTPLGMENDTLSNGSYLPFFLNLQQDLDSDIIINGLDIITLPLNLPLKTSFKCRFQNDKYIKLEGWISLHEDNLDVLLRNQSFVNNAKDYHISQNFKIESKIDVLIDKSCHDIQYINYTSLIQGENHLIDKVEYRVESTLYSNEQEKLGIQQKELKVKKGFWKTLLGVS